MATPDPKMHSITGTLTSLMLTERDDDYAFNNTCVANRTMIDIYKLTSTKNNKHSDSEPESIYNELQETTNEKLYSASTVEFGFTII